MREQRSIHGVEVGIVMPDGNLIWTEVSASPFLPSSCIVTTVDITTRKQAEKKLRESEENLNLVMRSIVDAIIATDAAGRITKLNPTAEALAGKLLSDALGRPLLEVFPFIEAALLEAVLARGQSQNSETLLLAADGARRWISTDLNPLLLDGNIEGAVVICRDVTEQRRTTEQLLTSERMVSVGILAAGVAHEINNPLAVITANLGLFVESVTAPGLPDDIVEGLADARDSAERIRVIVRDLMLFSRAEDDRLHPTDLTRILKSTLRMAQNEMRHRAKLIVNYGDIPLVQANKARLGQVFLNLIMNAVQAMPQGQAEANELRVTTILSAQGEVIISIEDTGCGMSPEVQRQLFTPFFTTKPTGQGTGLGLVISQRIVSNLGGRIEVESALGKGSVFRIFLPASLAKAEPTAAPIATPTVARRRKILIVDDEPTLVWAISKSLSAQHEVVTSTSGKEALRLISGGARFASILCDMRMPDMTGIDIYSSLMQSIPSQAARMIFMTGDTSTRDISEFLGRVPNQWIEKPFALQALRDLINGQLQNRPMSATSPAPSQ